MASGKIRAALAVLTTLFIFGIVALLVLYGEPTGSRDTINIAVGALIGAWAQSILGYYYAASPKEKNDPSPQ